MNANLKLNLDLKNILPALRKAQPLLLGLSLITLFAYTALVVNNAMNVKAAATAATPAPKVVFDKTTIQSLQTLSNVPDQVPTNDLGKTDPFSP